MLKARVYEHHQRLIVHDGTRWRRIENDWEIKVTRESYGPGPAPSLEEWAFPERKVTLTTARYGTVPVELTVCTTWRRLLITGLDS